MKTVIKIILISLFAVNVAMAQEETLLVNGSFDNLKIKNVSIDQLYTMDKDFKGLEVLGKPIRIDSIYKSAEPTWHFYYPGFVLTFIQFFPTGPELLQIEITSPEAGFTYFDENLFRSNQKNSRNSSKLQFETIDPKLPDEHKFGDQGQYIELNLMSGKLNRIIYKIDPNL